MKKLLFKNAWNEQLLITYAHPFFLYSIDGVFQSRHSLATVTAYGKDGGRITDSKAEMRNIVVVVQIQHNQIQNRNVLYDFFQPKQSGTMYYFDDAIERKIEYQVESVTVPEFGVVRLATISLLCPDPAFKDISEKRVSMAMWRGGIRFPLEIHPPFTVTEKVDTLIASIYNSNVKPLGLRVRFSASGEVKAPSLTEIGRQETLQADLTMQKGDVLEITTAQGGKSATLYRDGIAHNVINTLAYPPVWLQAEQGDNVFRYNAESGIDALSVDIYYSQTYWGGVKMDLNIYTPQFVFIGCIDVFTSFRWRNQLLDAGEIEIHCEATNDNILLSTPELFLHRADRDEIGILEGRKITDDNERGNNIAITGRLGNALFDRCIINKTYIFNGPVETAMRQLVTEQMPRIYGRIEMGALNGFTEKIQMQVSYKNLLSVLISMAKATNVFFRLRPDIPSGKLIFETYKGVDRSIGQKISPRVVFSDIDETLVQPEYEENYKKAKNFAYVFGEGEGNERIFVTVDQRQQGEALREAFVDAKDIRKENLTEAQYKVLLTERGKEKLSGLAPVVNFETETDETAYMFGRDYGIGDVVTTHKDKWGIIVDERVTEAEEIFEENAGAGKVIPVFGSPLPEKIDLGG